MKKILVIAAHPDDEVLGCGASIAKHVSQGDKVSILILGEGITSRKHLSTSKKIDQLKKLQKMCLNASKILGVENLNLESFPDNKFDSVPLLDLIHSIESRLERDNPDIVYTHCKSDVNIDHRRTLEAVESAVRPLPKSKIKQVLSFEVPSATEWNFVRDPFRPVFFNEINKVQLQRKINALKLYSSEKRSFPHPRSEMYLESLARIRGGQSGKNLAEAFEIIYQISE